MNRNHRITTWGVVALALALGAGAVSWKSAHRAAPIAPTAAASADRVDAILEKAKAGAQALSADDLREGLRATGDEDVERLRVIFEEAKAEHARGLQEHQALEAELHELTRDPAHVDPRKLAVLQGKMDAVEDELLVSTRHVQDAVMALAPAYERAALAKLALQNGTVQP